MLAPKVAADYSLHAPDVFGQRELILALICVSPKVVQHHLNVPGG